MQPLVTLLKRIPDNVRPLHLLVSDRQIILSRLSYQTANRMFIIGCETLTFVICNYCLPNCLPPAE